MSRLVLGNLFKLRRRPMTQVLALLLVLIFAGIQAPRWDTTETDFGSGVISEGEPVFIGEEPAVIEGDRPDSQPVEPADEGAAEQAAHRRRYLETTVDDNLKVLRWLAVIAGVMLVAGAIGSEYTWGTLRPFLTCAAGRAQFLGAQLIALAILVVTGMVLALAAAIASSLVVAQARGGVELGFLDGAYLGGALRDFVKTAFVLVPYLLIAVLATTVGRSALPGAVVGLGVLLVEGTFSTALVNAENWTRHIPTYLLSRNAEAVLGLSDSGFESLPDPRAATVVLFVYALLAGALSFYLFQRRDITA